MNFTITCCLDVISWWGYWAELKQRYTNQVEFGWKIAQLADQAAYDSYKAHLGDPPAT